MTTIANHHVDPHLLVVLGATSDLMRRKLLPAIYRLRSGKAVPGPLIILGTSRQAGLTDEGFRVLTAEALAAGGVEPNAAALWCSKCLHFQSLGAGTPEDFQALAARVRTLEQEHHLPGNRVFYLALPPTAYMASINGLGQAGLNQTPGWTRLVVEKPFGRDLASATALNEQIHRYFDESQIYRIDHYLGKETVQNLLIFRFANAIFEPLWHRNLVKSVQITVAESLGVGSRAGYYDQAGGLRDMVQNPFYFGTAKIGIDNQPCFPANYFCITLVVEFIAICRCSSVLPDNGIVNRVSCEPVPDNGCFSLVCDSNARQLLAVDTKARYGLSSNRRL